MKKKGWMTAACYLAIVGVPLPNITFWGEQLYLESKSGEDEITKEKKTEQKDTVKREIENVKQGGKETERESESETGTEPESETGMESEPASEILPSEPSMQVPMESQSVKEIFLNQPSEGEPSEYKVADEISPSESTTERTVECGAINNAPPNDLATEEYQEREAVSEILPSDPATEESIESEPVSEIPPSDPATEKSPESEPVSEIPPSDPATEELIESEPVSEIPPSDPTTEDPIESESSGEIPSNDPSSEESPESEAISEIPPSDPASEEAPESESVREIPVSEPSTEGEATESTTENEIFTESSTEKKTSQEKQPTESSKEQKKIIIRELEVACAGWEKLYDGSLYIPLTVTASQEGKGKVELKAYGEAESSDVGTWKVTPKFLMSGPDAEKFRLEVPEKDLTVTIRRRPLTVRIGDAKKEYGTSLTIQNLNFQDTPVTVTGFMEDGQVVSEAPPGFQAPQITFDDSIIHADSPMYSDGGLIDYQGALVAERRADGTITGNPTGNYYFELSGDYYRKGSITLFEKKQLDYNVQIRKGQGYRDEARDIFWISRGSSLMVIPEEGSGFDSILFSEELTENGIWMFALEQRAEGGEVLARSEERSVCYQIDQTPPEIKLFYDGQETCKNAVRENICITGENIRDGESGVKAVEYAVRACTDKPSESAYFSYQEGEPIVLDQEGTWQIIFLVKDQVGNTKIAASEKILIDKTKPLISFSGLSEGTSCQEPGELNVIIKDENLTDVQSECELLDGTGKRVSSRFTRTNTETVEKISLDSLNNLPDGSYTVQVKSLDRAGNEAESSLHFRVNGSGSAYYLSKGTEWVRGQYYLQEGTAITVMERNKDKILDRAVICLRDGKFTLLSEGRDYRIQIRKSGDSWIYEYQIFPKCFSEEGAYTVVFQSLDQAGNQNDSRKGDITLEFFVDHTAPACFLTEAEKAEGRELRLWCRDNGKICWMELWKDGKRLFRTAQKQVKVLIEPENKASDFRILARDCAGNLTWSDNYHMFAEGEAKGEENQNLNETEREDEEWQDTGLPQCIEEGIYAGVGWYMEPLKDSVEGSSSKFAEAEEESFLKKISKDFFPADKEKNNGHKAAGVTLLTVLWIALCTFIWRKMDFF